MSDRVADGVADYRRGDDQYRDDADVDVILGGDDARDQDRGLAGQDEADEERRLAEDEQRDESVDESTGETMYLVQQVRDDGGEHQTILVDNN